ncbi:MAG: Clp protease N-terminal domain-containing protein, partial [Trebonia sp.]
MDLTTRSQQALSTAVKAAAERGNPAVVPAHLAVALLDNPDGLPRPLLQKLGVDPVAIRAEAQQLVDALPSASGQSVAAPQSSRALLSLLAGAERAARERSDEYVSTEHLL